MRRIGSRSRWVRTALGLGMALGLGVAFVATAGVARAEDSDFTLDRGIALGPVRDASALLLGMRQPPPTERPRAPLLRRQRPNTISIGIQGDYGIIRGNSRLADGFSDGPGYAFRFR